MPGDAGRGASVARDDYTAQEARAASQALVLQRRTAEQLLIAGQRREGLSALTGVLRASRIAGPGRGPALLRLLWQRIRLWWRGLEFNARESGELDSWALQRVDACSVAARTLVGQEPVKGAVFGAIQLRLALDAGEPTRVIEGLANEIILAATRGARAESRVARLIERAREIERGARDPAAQAHLTTAIAAQALLCGRYAEAAEGAARAESLYRERCTGVAGALNRARSIWAAAALMVGEIPQVMPQLSQWLAEAREAGDLETQRRLGVQLLWGALVSGDVAAVRAEVEPTLAGRGTPPRQAADLNALYLLALVSLYERADAHALLRVRELYQPFFRSLLSRVQLHRVVVMGYCANLELAIAARGHEQERRLRRAEVFARRLAREGVAHADAQANLTRAGIAHQRGDTASVRVYLERACANFEATDQQLQAACVRMRLGQLLGGVEAEVYRERARRDLARRAVAEPERFVAIFAPGYPD